MKIEKETRFDIGQKVVWIGDSNGMEWQCLKGIVTSWHLYGNGLVVYEMDNGVSHVAEDDLFASVAEADKHVLLKYRSHLESELEYVQHKLAQYGG